MKKLIAVLIALAMVLSMSVMAFAGFNGVKSPVDITNEHGATQDDYNNAISLEDWKLSDYANWWQYIDIRRDIEKEGIYTKEDGSFMTWEEAWQAYYVYVLQNATSDIGTAAPEIISIVQEGYVPAGDAISIAGQTIMGGIGGDGESGDLSGVIDEIIGNITGGNQEPEISSEEYVDELAALIDEGVAFEDITKKIGEDLASGKIVVSQLPEIVEIISNRVDAGEIENNETVQQVLEFINSIGGEGGIEFPDFGDIKLPWDNDNSSSGSFLDTILGIIGSIGDLFNPSEPDDPSVSDPSNPGTTDPIPDTGDVSCVAVAAVAAVAGIALVLTRKKSDAE